MSLGLSFPFLDSVQQVIMSLRLVLIDFMIQCFLKQDSYSYPEACFRWYVGQILFDVNGLFVLLGGCELVCVLTTFDLCFPL